ncbi:MAG: CDP-glycerol glycerophosphotransferase family protein [Clostridia bacterium]|nr:CDP-glycerol glycerophosphotransferase family protein [Clostridia bacterium]
MKKLIYNLKYIKLYDLLSIFIFIFALPISLCYKLINKLKQRSLWLVCEDGYHARDNGYVFFKYIKEKHAKDFCFYVIDKKQKDYKKVQKYDNIIQYKSFKHWIYYMAATYNISSQKSGNPSAPFFYLLHVKLNMFNNRVFLQHGITKDLSEWLFYKNTKFKFFVCGAKKEYDYLTKNYGYPDGHLIYTGFPRFDGLHDINVNEKQILVMPTWRNWLGRDTNGLTQRVDITKTNYFISWMKLLNNENFIRFIEENGYTVLFYPHINMQKYINDFKFKSESIKKVTLDTNIQGVLKSSALLITDYSSVYMDFAYMNKPVIYFQFDMEEYRKKQYSVGYFDYNEDGFGPVFDRTEELVKYLINNFEKNIFLEDKYNARMKEFFELHDKNNCERVYKLLKGVDIINEQATN